MIGPSNPVISIGPILAVPGMREAIAGAGVPVVAVSPYVAGKVVKGPDRPLHGGARAPDDARPGSPRSTPGLITAMVVDSDDPDPPPQEIPTLDTATLMDGAGDRARVARTVLDYAASLAEG